VFMVRFKNMNKRRSRLEIYFDILNTINNGEVRPTRIMYKANLSWEVLQEIFETLIKNGFITEGINRNHNQYNLTAKGQNALLYYQKSIDGLQKTSPILQ
jgi:predicted transcriptional regulator